jgi:single-strand DNA-binding protein
MNVAVLQGHLSSAPNERFLPTGERVVTLEVSIRRVGDRADTVPVAWMKAPANATELAPGTGVVVLGRVRRRFFRAGGFTQSRTEVVSETVVPIRQSKKVAKLLAEAVDLLSGEPEP